MLRFLVSVWFAWAVSSLSAASAQDAQDIDKSAIYDKLLNSFVNGDEMGSARNHLDDLAVWCEEGDGRACWYRGVNLRKAPGAYNELGSVNEVRSIADQLIAKSKLLLLKACEAGNAPACREGRWALVYNGASYRYIPAYKVDWKSMSRMNAALIPNLRRLCLEENDTLACADVLASAKESSDEEELRVANQGLEANCQEKGDYNACLILIEADAVLKSPKYETFDSFVELLRRACIAETERHKDAPNMFLVSCSFVEEFDKGGKEVGITAEEYYRFRRISVDRTKVLKEDCDGGDQNACDEYTNELRYGEPSYSRFNEAEYRKADADKIDELKSSCFETLRYFKECGKYYQTLVDGAFAPPDPGGALNHAREICYSHHQGIADFCSEAARLIVYNNVPAEDSVIFALPLLVRACASGDKNDCNNSLHQLEDDVRFAFSWDDIPNSNSELRLKTALAQATWNACENHGIEVACQAAVSINYVSVVPTEKKKIIIRRGCDANDIESCILEFEYNLSGEEPKKLFNNRDPFVIGRLNQIADVLEQACENRSGRACYIMGDVYSSFHRSDLSRDDLLSFYVDACENGEYRGCLTMGSVMDSNVYKCLHYGKLSSTCLKEPEFAALFQEKSCRAWNGGHTCSSSARYFDKIGNTNKKIKMLKIGCPEKEFRYASWKSCFALAEAYLNADGVPQNYSKAYEYARTTCQKSVAKGCLLEADLLIGRKIPELSEPYERAFDSLEDACIEMNSIEACTRALDLAAKGYGREYSVKNQLDVLQERERDRKEACKDPSSVMCLAYSWGK